MGGTLIDRWSDDRFLIGWKFCWYREKYLPYEAWIALILLGDIKSLLNSSPEFSGLAVFNKVQIG